MFTLCRRFSYYNNNFFNYRGLKLPYPMEQSLCDGTFALSPCQCLAVVEAENLWEMLLQAIKHFVKRIIGR